MKFNRPLSPHLTIYKPQLTSALSIFHRISGGFLAVTLLLTILCLKFCDISLNFYEIYWYCFFIITNMNWLTTILANFTLLAFCYHISNGIRHLFWDFGFFLDLSKVYITGTLTILLSGFLFTALLYILRT